MLFSSLQKLRVIQYFGVTFMFYAICILQILRSMQVFWMFFLDFFQFFEDSFSKLCCLLLQVSFIYIFFQVLDFSKVRQSTLVISNICYLELFGRSLELFKLKHPLSRTPLSQTVTISNQLFSLLNCFSFFISNFCLNV